MRAKISCRSWIHFIGPLYSVEQEKNSDMIENRACQGALLRMGGKGAVRMDRFKAENSTQTGHHTCHVIL